MGGKKPIGEHPSRGHLQRRFTGVTRRGGHTHRGNYWDPKSPFDDHENPNIVPVIEQEFSLFSEFDLSPDRFGILNKQTLEQHKVSDLKDEIKIENVTTFCLQNNMLPSQTSQGQSLPSTSQPHHIHQQEQIEEYGGQSHVEMLQMTVFHLTSALERLEFQFYAAMNNLYCYGLPTHHQPYQPQPQQVTGGSSSPTTMTVPNEESSSSMIKRINERLSTLEGRQKIIQSKISQLDNLYGQTTQAWGRSIKEIVRGAKLTNPQPESQGNGGRDEVELLDSSEPLNSPKTHSNNPTVSATSTSGSSPLHQAGRSFPTPEPPPDPQPRQENQNISASVPFPSFLVSPPNEPTPTPPPLASSNKT
jgi:hypothetical protein